MTQTPPEPPTDNRGVPPLSPLTPKPGALAVALLLTALLFFNLWMDANSVDYDGKYMTFAAVGLIAGILGVDVSRFWRGKGDQ